MNSKLSYIRWIIFFIPFSLKAQFVQQGNKLTANDATAMPTQGKSISISGDGNTIIIGGYGDQNGSPGAAYIFVKSGSNWIQQGSKLIGLNAKGLAAQGISVDISRDGNTAIVGGNGDSSGVGAAWIFTRNGTIWTCSAKLVGTGAVATPNVGQGGAVAISSDGNTAMIGGPQNNNNRGGAWVFKRIGNNWVQQDFLLPDDLIGPGQFGYAVDISGDGNTAIISGWLDNNQAGAGWVYTRDGNNWSKSYKLIVNDYSGSSSLNNIGDDVAISADGNTILISGYKDNDNLGSVWVFVKSNGTWIQQGDKLHPDENQGSYVLFGNSISLSSNGNVAVIGAFGDMGQVGAVWVFKRNCEIWSQYGNKLVGTNYIYNGWPPEQGTDVAISEDGLTFIESGYEDDNFVGATWVFHDSPLNNMCNINISLGKDTLLCNGQIINWNVTNPNSQYLWQDGSVNPTYTVTKPGNYSVKVTQGNCCTESSITVSFKQCEKVMIEMPNLFTPNNDHKNDNFYPTKIEGIELATLKIFNRWGDNIFETQNISNGWDGKVREKDSDTGIYYWSVSYIDVNKKEGRLNGWLNLVR